MFIDKHWVVNTHRFAVIQNEATVESAPLAEKGTWMYSLAAAEAYAYVLFGRRYENRDTNRCGLLVHRATSDAV